MAAQGQSGFVSAGDAAAYDDNSEIGTTGLSVDAPGDSPYITTAGGTTVPWSGSFGTPVNVNVTAERAWGWDYLWAPIAPLLGLTLTQSAEAFVAGGGGGYSNVEQMPSYQYGVPGTHFFSAVQYLTPTNIQNVGGVNEPTAWIFNPTPSVTHGVGAGRALPDVSADADPETARLEWSPSFLDTRGPELQGGWGGTSFVAPQLNGVAAVIDSALGHRVGFWNPSIYDFATQHNSPFNSLNTSGTTNDNIFFTGTPGTAFNAAVGLATPNISQLAKDFRDNH